MRSGDLVERRGRPNVRPRRLARQAAERRRGGGRGGGSRGLPEGTVGAVLLIYGLGYCASSLLMRHAVRPHRAPPGWAWRSAGWGGVLAFGVAVQTGWAGWLASGRGPLTRRR